MKGQWTMLKSGRETFAFFGSGIDLTDQQIESTYHSLLDSYNLIQKQKEEKKALERNRPLIQFPKIELPRINIPFLGINIGDKPEEAKIESANDPSLLPEESDNK